MARHSLAINNRTSFKVPRELLEKILVTTLQQLGPRIKTETSLALVADVSMARLNKMYRGKNRTTDVLSFSFLRGTKIVDEPALIGEIIISPTRAQKQAKLFGHSNPVEMGLLFLHGLLHILGFDHEKSAAAAKKMGRAEQTILKKIPLLQTARRGLVTRELVYPSINTPR